MPGPNAGLGVQGPRLWSSFCGRGGGGSWRWGCLCERALLEVGDRGATDARQGGRRKGAQGYRQQVASGAAPLRRRSAPPRAAPPPGAVPRDPSLVTGGRGAEGKPARRPPGAGLAATPSGCPHESASEPERESEREPSRARWALPAMDHKPLLQDRPPTYNLEAGQGDFACGPHGYGAIPAAPPPPPYPYLVTGGPGGRGRACGVCGAGEGSGGNALRGRGRGGPSGRGAPGANLRPSPPATFYPPNQLSSGRCQGPARRIGNAGPWCQAALEEGLGDLSHQEAGGAPCVWALPERAQHTWGVARPRPALLRKHHNPVSN